jgi:hypothetical protein
MRDKEALEGRALYYVDREKQREWFTAQMKAPVTSAFLDELKAAGKGARQAREERKNNPPPAPAPKPTPAPIIGADNGYAAAINAAMQEASAPTPAPVAPKPAPKLVEPVKPAESIKTVNLKPAPGESMLEFAKRMREARASA